MKPYFLFLLLLLSMMGCKENINYSANPAISVSDISIIEPTNTDSTYYFTVRLSEPSQDIVTVDYETGDSSANSSDYLRQAGSIVFQPNKTAQIIGIKVFGDVVCEAEKYFTLKLKNPINAVLLRNSAVCKIIDNKAPKIFFDGTSITIYDTVNSLNEPLILKHFFKVRLLNPFPCDTVKVRCKTVKVGVDTAYVPFDSLYIFLPGDIDFVDSVSIKNDAKNQKTETFYILLDSEYNGWIDKTDGKNKLTVTIKDTLKSNGSNYIEPKSKITR